jgi:hypothetical protein
MEEITAHEQALNAAIEAAESGRFEEALAWAQIAQTILANNTYAATLNLAMSAADFIEVPSPENYGAMGSDAATFRKVVT